MNKTTLFTWGYYGWGNHTPQLVQAVDAVESSRGFEPPLFVDIRIRRTVRAAGFQGNAFEKLLGPSRHQWMKSLGNEFIVKQTGPGIQIADPSAAEKLLDLALEAKNENRRVLFFCGCALPKLEGEIACHRDTVADLVLEAASHRTQPIEIIEWPGGQPRRIDLDVPSDVFKSLVKGRISIPLKESFDLASLAGLPWGSIVSVRSGDQVIQVISGRATYQKEQWALPVFRAYLDPDTTNEEVEEQSTELRRSWGMEVRMV